MSTIAALRLILTIISCALFTALLALTAVISAGGEVEFSSNVVRSFNMAAAAFWIALILPAPLAAIWLLHAPQRWLRQWQSTRPEKGYTELEAALLSAAGGNAKAAQRHADRAANLLKNAGAARLVAAQTAEAADDLVTAEAHYAAMITDPRTALVGRRGLAAAALSRGDYRAAAAHARAAFDTTPQAYWAFELLFDALLRARRWEAALATLTAGRKHNHVDNTTARRRRSVIYTALAGEECARNPQLARKLIEHAIAADAHFPPSIVTAAQLFAKTGKTKRAMSLIEEAYRHAPHPAFATAYWHITRPMALDQRTRHRQTLAQSRPDHAESQILLAHIALDRNDANAAKDILQPLLARQPQPHARLCALMADIEDARNAPELANTWRRKAVDAGPAPNTQHIDSETGTFLISQDQWPELVYAYGNRAELNLPTSPPPTAPTRTSLTPAPLTRRLTPPDD